MSVDNPVVEAATASLVREYLSRKGLRGTLDKMDEEMPRNDQSISNRQALMKHLHIDKLMRKNKDEIQPLKAMLEVMTRYFIQHGNQGSPEHPTPRDTKLGNGSGTEFSSNIDFSPQVNEPSDMHAIKSRIRPSTASLNAIKGKTNDLVMDEDVEGETMIGSGKSGIMAGGETSEFNVSYTTRSQSNRPLSSKQRPGAIMSTNDLQKPRRQMQKPKNVGISRLSVSEQQQSPQYYSQPMDSKDTYTNGRSYDNPETRDNTTTTPNSLSFLNSSKSSDKPKKLNSNNESSPVSFEALLMKGQERASLLQRIGMDRKHEKLEDESYSIDHSSMVSDKISSSSHLPHRKSEPNLLSNRKTSDLELGDVDDLEADVSNLNIQRPTSALQKPKPIQKIHSTPIDIKTAMNLKNLVLGSPCQQYTDEWLLQAYSFSDMPHLKYGIVQKKGGPCGVLAAVQACLLKELLFGTDRLQSLKWSNPSRPERSKALSQAIANILWRAGGESRAVVTLPSDNIHIVSSSKFKQDGVTEKLSLFTFTNYQELSSFLLQSISQFENDGNPGVIITMYSTILSRKPHQVKSDFDTPDGKMIAAHGYCTQELVNLLLTGKATSNVFNDSVTLGSDDNEQQVILKGVAGRSEIGLLSLFEHYKSCQVGTYYKTPKHPIWVICSESHFSVLFSSRKDLVNDWKVEKRFDMYYYDGLAKQQEEIKLTISNLNRNFIPPSSEEDLVPPLEHCIRTKWSDAEIDWNGYDPIL